MKIKAITVVATQGVSQYEVGRNGVERIELDRKQIGGNEHILIYEVYFGNRCMMQINANSPIIIEYEDI